MIERQIGGIYLRHQNNRALVAYGPKSEEHAEPGRECPACFSPIKAGDITTLIVLGPGDDPAARERAAAGRFYRAVAVEVHYACAAGTLPELHAAAVAAGEPLPEEASA